jgi:hypothetical protein
MIHRNDAEGAEVYREPSHSNKNPAVLGALCVSAVNMSGG